MASVSSDPWDHYLLSPSSRSLQGWCTNRSTLDKAVGKFDEHLVGSADLSLSTKAPQCTSVGSYSCFVSKEDETKQYELDPVRIFTDNLARCNSSTECSPLFSCVVPRPDQQLVRISVLRNHGATSIEDTIVWNGPKEEIWEQGTRMPPTVANPSKRPLSFTQYK